MKHYIMIEGITYKISNKDYLKLLELDYAQSETSRKDFNDFLDKLSQGEMAKIYVQAYYYK